MSGIADGPVPPPTAPAQPGSPTTPNPSARECDPVRTHAGADLVLVRVLSLRTSTQRRFEVAFAGVIEAVGAAVTDIETGDAVFGRCESAFAGYVCAPRRRIALKPASLSFDEAADVALADYTP